MFNLSCLFLLDFFFFFVLVVSLSQKSNLLSCHSLVFCSFVFRLESSLQKNNLSSSELVLTQFGYRGFLFLSHAVELWFVVFSKLALVSLVYYKIPFQPG